MNRRHCGSKSKNVPQGVGDLGGKLGPNLVNRKRPFEI